MPLFRSAPWFIPPPPSPRRPSPRNRPNRPPAQRSHKRETSGASMLIVSILAFFVLTFLLASIAVAISWMAFLKSRAEETEAEQGERGLGDEAAPLMRTERLSTINFWDNLLARFDFMEIVK